MLISHEWLKRYVPDLNQSPEEIDEALTLIGFEVEGIETKGLPDLAKVIVGEVLEKEQHPNADKLSVCKVNTGDPANPAGIVCGAKNFKVGDRVPVATLGAVLPGGFEIKQAKLRGVESAGMMCSARELGLGEDHEGLLILEQRPEIGTPINDVFPENDVVYDVEITPNRPDCLSHVGLARELAAHFQLQFNPPTTELTEKSFDEKASDGLIKEVNLVADDVCPYYTAHFIKGVKIAPSPDWLKTAIEAIGLRPINNVVDVTNYVLHETGQPLHAFDAKKISGDAIIVRKAEAGEKLTTLDDKVRELREHDTLIADEKQGLVIAGVMGTIDAEVDESTVDIVLEAAWFSKTHVRKTSRELGLSTDSSYRFERGIDPKSVLFAAYRALDLIIETAGGALCKQSIIAGDFPKEPTVISFTPDYIRAKCGFEMSDELIHKNLEALQIEIEGDASDWKATIPSFRGDLERPIDLVEEALRIYGTDKIPDLPVVSEALNREHSGEWLIRKKTAEYLCDRGFSEAYNYTLLDAELIEKEKGEFGPLRLLNPISSDQTHLRPSLIPGLVEVLKTNQNHGLSNGKFFEWGRVYKTGKGGVTECLGLAFVIQEDPDLKEWKQREATDFYRAKAIMSDLLGLAGLKWLDHQLNMESTTIYGQDGHFVTGGNLQKGGFEIELGMLDLKYLKNQNLKGTIYAGCLAIHPNVTERKRKKPYYKDFSLFPP
ncbi:MAG: phenylalanine--tRNA ligase subunit beta, partial [Opitutales bacterium]|nr:phenylalanine--tRNA ligase subunit beta [Opitutales bacterium]